MCNLEHKLAYVTWCWNYVPKFLAYDLRHQVAADVALQLICLFAVVVFAQYLNCYRYNSKSLRCCVVVCTRISSWAWNLSLQWPFISTVYAKSKNSSYTGLCAVTFHIYCYIFLFFFSSEALETCTSVYAVVWTRTLFTFEIFFVFMLKEE